MTVIDLAPHNSYGLALRSPVIVAPGCIDAGNLRDIDPQLIGAITTRTAVLETPRTQPPRWAAVPAGLVVERLPVVTFRTLLTEAKRWLRSPVPVLLSLRGNADELAYMAVQLETVEGVAGLLVAFDETVTAAMVADVRASTPLPLLITLPQRLLGASEVAAIVAAGADALVVFGYPRASAMIDGELVDGVLLGPTLAPSTLHGLRVAAEAVTVPRVAWGGIADATIAQHCLQAGAVAVLVDGAMYGDPQAPMRIGSALQRNTASAAAKA